MKRYMLDRMVEQIEDGGLTEYEVETLQRALDKVKSKLSSDSMSGKHTSKEIIKQMESDIESGSLNISEIARKHNVTRATVLSHKKKLENTMEELKRFFPDRSSSLFDDELPF